MFNSVKALQDFVGKMRGPAMQLGAFARAANCDAVLVVMPKDSPAPMVIGLGCKVDFEKLVKGIRKTQSFETKFDIKTN